MDFFRTGLVRESVFKIHALFFALPQWVLFFPFFARAGVRNHD